MKRIGSSARTLLFSLAASANLALATDTSTLVTINESKGSWHLVPDTDDPGRPPDKGDLTVTWLGVDPPGAKVTPTPPSAGKPLDLTSGSILVMDLPGKGKGHRVWKLQDDAGKCQYLIDYYVDPDSKKAQAVVGLSLGPSQKDTHIETKMDDSYKNFIKIGKNYLIIVADSWATPASH